MASNEYTHSDKQVRINWKRIPWIKKLLSQGLSVHRTNKCQAEWEERQHYICCYPLAIATVSNIDGTDRRCSGRRTETEFQQYRHFDQSKLCSNVPFSSPLHLQTRRWIFRKSAPPWWWWSPTTCLMVWVWNSHLIVKSKRCTERCLFRSDADPIHF